jgi:hypothetical protein
LKSPKASRIEQALNESLVNPALGSSPVLEAANYELLTSIIESINPLQSHIEFIRLLFASSGESVFDILQKVVPESDQPFALKLVSWDFSPIILTLVGKRILFSCSKNKQTQSTYQENRAYKQSYSNG